MPPATAPEVSAEEAARKDTRLANLQRLSIGSSLADVKRRLSNGGGGGRGGRGAATTTTSSWRSFKGKPAARSFAPPPISGVAKDLEFSEC